MAASVIKAFTYEAYTIPTSSMEGSMLVGDFLFVNKMSYGTRIAMTPLSFPLVHDTIPVVKTRSYIRGVSLPYLRLPALRKIKRNDIVVFNWPADSRTNRSTNGPTTSNAALPCPATRWRSAWAICT